MDVSSFKLLKDGALQIGWSEPSEVENETNETSRKCHGAADPELYISLEDLREHVIKICELNKKSLAHIDINSLSFSYSGENKILGCTITFFKKLLSTPGSKIIITTPKKFVEPINDNSEPTNVFDEDCAKLILKLASEIKEYIAGKRQQVDIDEVDENDEN